MGLGSSELFFIPTCFTHRFSRFNLSSFSDFKSMVCPVGCFMTEILAEYFCLLLYVQWMAIPAFNVHSCSFSLCG